jgi:hypothetical protein
VSPQAWGRTLDLEINGHHLVVGFLAAFNLPWQFYSFSIANPMAVEKLLDRIGKPAISVQPADARPTPTPAPIADVPQPQEGASKSISRGQLANGKKRAN